ncbi:hypothetical protein GCM10020331_022050 [Ectobacillus funiculus]
MKIYRFFAPCIRIVFDVVFPYVFLIGGQTKAALVYIEGLSNNAEIDDQVIAPLMSETEGDFCNPYELLEEKLHISKMREIKTLTDCIENISVGHPVLFNTTGGIWISFLDWLSGKSEQLENRRQRVLCGDQGKALWKPWGSIQLSCDEKKSKSPALKMKPMTIGRYTSTNIVIAYMEGLADQTLIKEVENRLQRIEIDSVLESGYIEELIEDNPYSPFPQLINTERPDVAAANLLEGRVVILVDGTPFVFNCSY